MQVDSGYLSEPRSIEFPTENSLTAFMKWVVPAKLSLLPLGHPLVWGPSVCRHGCSYYPPTNKDFTLQDGEKAPLLIKIHGGPTSQAGTAFNLGIQFWTSRGACEGCALHNLHGQLNLQAGLAFHHAHGRHDLHCLTYFARNLWLKESQLSHPL